MQRDKSSPISPIGIPHHSRPGILGRPFGYGSEGSRHTPCAVRQSWRSPRRHRLRHTECAYYVAGLLLCLLWTVSIGAAEKDSSYNAALESIRAEGLGKHIESLADPAMEGRESGTRGAKAAGDYLADQYAKLHLRGGGDDQSFFQAFVPNFRNVLAMLQGSDPKLRDQVILISAHYDHIGYGNFSSLGPSGYIHPGADDNASGTSAVLALAKAFTLLAESPKRSILFVNWDAEEKGLLGSKHWVAHPTIPLNQVVAGLNLDMIGRLRDKHLLVVGTRSGCGWRRLLCTHNDAGIEMEFSWLLKASADHYPLFEHEIPVLLFHTGLHNEYHRPGDVPKLINREGMTEITRMVFGVVYELANGPTTPAFRAAAQNETPETEKAILDQIGDAKPADRLGVAWVEDAVVSGGVVVSEVKADSPAERAGLQAGDRIVRFAGRDIRNDDDFYGAVSAAASPASLVAKRSEQEKPLKLKVTLDGNPLRWGVVWRVDDAEPGVIILTHVVPGSPAAHAGLRGGDRIYQVGGRTFTDEAAFSLLAKTPADSLQLLIERDSRLRTVTIQFRRSEPLKRAA
jgi:hypothetical protein